MSAYVRERYYIHHKKISKEGLRLLMDISISIKIPAKIEVFDESNIYQVFGVDKRDDIQRCITNNQLNIAVVDILVDEQGQHLFINKGVIDIKDNTLYTGSIVIKPSKIDHVISITDILEGKSTNSIGKWMKPHPKGELEPKGLIKPKLAEPAHRPEKKYTLTNVNTNKTYLYNTIVEGMDLSGESRYTFRQLAKKMKDDNTMESRWDAWKLIRHY